MDLMKAAAHLYGAELRKCLTESITKSRRERQIFSYESEGTAQPFEEAEAEWMAKDPETWKHIKKNATQFICPLTQKTMAKQRQVRVKNSKRKYASSRRLRVS